MESACACDETDANCECDHGTPCRDRANDAVHGEHMTACSPSGAENFLSLISVMCAVGNHSSTAHERTHAYVYRDIELKLVARVCAIKKIR